MRDISLEITHKFTYFVNPERNVFEKFISSVLHQLPVDGPELVKFV